MFSIASVQTLVKIQIYINTHGMLIYAYNRYLATSVYIFEHY